MTSPRRISVVGNSGSGKSTLARRIAARLGVPHVELDAMFWGPAWTRAEPERFRRQVASRCAADAWVVDGNYRPVIDTVWSRADTVVWLDLPRRVVMLQLLERTLRRLVLRTPIWNGNREPWQTLARWDPEESVLRWAWTQHAAYVSRYERAMSDPANARLAFHRLRSHADAERLLATLTQ
ncbi:MAG: hypothetical protein WCJ30_08650 [Deltaproteobacteria bacterium]